MLGPSALSREILATVLFENVPCVSKPRTLYRQIQSSPCHWVLLFVAPLKNQSLPALDSSQSEISGICCEFKGSNSININTQQRTTQYDKKTTPNNILKALLRAK